MQKSIINIISVYTYLASIMGRSYLFFFIPRPLFALSLHGNCFFGYGENNNLVAKKKKEKSSSRNATKKRIFIKFFFFFLLVNAIVYLRV